MQHCRIVPVLVTARYGLASSTALWFQAEGDGSVYMGASANEQDTMERVELQNGTYKETPKRRNMVDKLRARLVADGWTEVGNGDTWFSYMFERSR